MKQSFRLPKVYPITDTHVSGLSHAEQVTLFADGGASLVQLREKHMPSLQFYEAAKKALVVAVTRRLALVINDRVDIALAIGALGVHLGQDDLPVEAARRLLGNEAIIGYSTHSLPQVLEASKLPIDYVALGPIFQTSTKSDTWPEVGLEGLRAARGALVDRPLVAIGGITPANAADVIGAGADSVAMISGLLTDPSGVSSALRVLLAALPR
jgi:thiamine-phosphate pyrophosphorylase